MVMVVTTSEKLVLQSTFCSAVLCQWQTCQSTVTMNNYFKVLFSCASPRNRWNTMVTTSSKQPSTAYHLPTVLSVLTTNSKSRSFDSCAWRILISCWWILAEYEGEVKGCVHYPQIGRNINKQTMSRGKGFFRHENRLHLLMMDMIFIILVRCHVVRAHAMFFKKSWTPKN